ncbi:MAG: hypothetical protein V1779_06990 [bacterium]
MKKIYKLLLIVILIFNSQNILSQNESGQRNLDSTNFRYFRSWLDSSTYLYQVQYPIIRNIPPLSTNMPYDIMIGYIYFDSLMKYPDVRQVDSLIFTWQTMNDTLSYALKYLYMLIDYNPIIFSQYAIETRMNRKTTNELMWKHSYDSSFVLQEFGRYTENVREIVISLCNRVYKLTKNGIINQNYTKDAFWAAVESDYILKIKVLNIDSALDINSSYGDKRYNVTAEVLDTIKGKVFKSIDVQPTVNTVKGDKVQNSINPLIHFQYTPRNYNEYGYKPKKDYLDPIRDSAFVNPDGSFKMELNQEAVIFLRHHNHKFDNEYDYFDLSLEPYCSNNALPIIDGKVRDVNNFWSEQLYLDYPIWKAKYEEIKNRILDRIY